LSWSVQYPACHAYPDRGSGTYTTRGGGGAVALTTAAVTIAVPITAARKPPPRPKQADEAKDAVVKTRRTERLMALLGLSNIRRRLPGAGAIAHPRQAMNLVGAA
jgi:hypothetical protein